MKDDFFDFFLAQATLDAAMFMLHEITNKCGGNWDWDAGTGQQIIFTPEYSPQAFVCMTSVVRCKRSLGKSVYKDRKILKAAKEMMQEYCKGLPVEKLLEIQKYIREA